MTSRIWRAIKRFGKLTKILIKDQPKCAIITCGHGWSFFEKGMMLLYLKIFGIQSVITPNSGLILRSFDSFLFRRFFKLIVNQSKYVVCQGDYWKKSFQPFIKDPQKLVVIKNWISPDSITVPLQPFSIKDRNDIKLVYLGWIEKYKGLDDLVQAVKICKEKNLNVHLDIWGAGSYKKPLQRLINEKNISDCAVLNGWASKEIKKQIYEAQPIAILPSHYEGMPNVVLEAMAHGMPVIASKISTLPEIIESGRNGLMYTVGDVHELAQVIENLGGDVLLQKRFRENAKLSLDAYSLEKASNRLAKLLNENKPKVLLLTDWFTPAYRAGGPIKSCDNIVKTLGSHVDIRVLTSINDLGDVRLDVPKNKWVPYHESKVYYASNFFSYSLAVVKQILLWNPSKIHINGVFSIKSSIFPLLTAKIFGKRKKIIVSLRGMLMPSALHIKARKKRIYLTIAKTLGLFKRITVHTTNEDELNLSKNTLRHFNNVTIPNLPELLASTASARFKESGTLDIVIVGRVHQIKNIHLLPKFLQLVTGTIRTTLIGHLEDTMYLEAITKSFENLPQHDFRYLGEVNGNKVKEIIKQNHVLFLASKSENYGHAIVESLSLNRPVIISSATPWHELEFYSAGYNYNIDEEDKFVFALQKMVDCSNTEYQEYVEGAKKYCKKKVFKDETVSDYLSIYQS